MSELTPDQQIENVQASLAALRALPRHQGQAEVIHAAEAQLAELIARHAVGLLLPLRNDDGVPF